MDEENFDGLSVDERCAHKHWRARVSGYRELVSIFDDIPDERSDDWNKYVPIVKAILLDNNDPALEKGLEAVLNFILKANVAAKIVSQVVAGVVKRCVASTRIRMKDLALQVCLGCVEIEKQNVVIDELLKGTEAKNPKISIACVHVLAEIVKAFGACVLPVEGILKKLPVWLEDKDQNMRNEAKALTIELYRWLGNDMKTNILKPEILRQQKLAEITSELSKIKVDTPVPSRFLKSSQRIQKGDVSDGENVIDETQDEGMDEPTPIEPLKDVKPVEILSRIPGEFYSQVKAPKWVERKEALENLEKILSGVEKIQNGDFHEIVNTLVNVISKDANITVVCLAVKCVTLLAQKLGVGFSSYSSLVLKALLEKLKDKKASVVQTLRDALDAIFDTSTFDLFAEDLSEGLRNKNPNVKSEVALFLSRCFSRLSPASMGKKSLKPLFGGLVTCLSDQDPSVRDQSARALGVAIGIMGEKGLSPFLKELDNTKLSKIKEFTISFLEGSDKPKSAPSSKKQTKITVPKSTLETTSEQPRMKNSTEHSKNKKTESALQCKSENTFKESVADVIPESTVKALSDKNWSIRMEAISQLQLLADSMSAVSEDLSELDPILSSRILDSNPKISTATINLVTSLARKIGSPFRDLRIFLPALLKAVGDVKGPVREAAVDSLTKIGEICGYGEIFRSECLPESLKTGSSATKAKLWRWVGESLRKATAKEVSKSDLESILPILFSSLEDKSADVRSEASNAVEGFLKFLPLEAMKDLYEKCCDNPNGSAMKMIFDKSKSALQVPELTAKAAANNAKQKSSKTPKVSRNKVSFAEDSKKPPLLDVNNMKNQRVMDEHKHKTAKWEFSTPRVEFVELLKGLTLAANFSQELISLMFHTDFRCHIKAMDMLTEEISKNSIGIVCNLDLILRWLTLRFFDGNPTVLSKSLDFIITAFDHLKETNYSLLDSEAAAFVPYLVMKLGDSKENIQAKVKEILVKLTSVYPVSKLKKFVMDGAKSNIARQRANCLDIIVSYISVYGDSVYLKEIESVSETVGKLLKDRDPGVKKKAFAVAGILYNKEGEKILKLIEKQAGEDFRLVEERIRRYVAAKPADLDECISEDPGILLPEETANAALEISPVEPTLQISQVPLDNGEPTPILEVVKEIHPTRFQWDAKLVSEIEDMANLRVHPSELQDIDLAFMQEDSKPRPRVFQNLRSKPKSTPNSILSNLESIGDDDLTASKNGMKYIDMILNSGRGEELDEYADLLMHKITLTLEKLDGKRYDEVLENYGTAFSLLLALCDEKRFIEEFSEERLYDTLEQLLLVISNNKFSGRENEVYRKTVNNIILKILENARKTPLLRCLLKMLGETRETGSSMVSGKLNELCMKCLWKLNRAQATWDEELDYGVIYPVIREFLRGLPAPWWKFRPGDMSLRTVKTVLRTMVKMRGERVLDDLGEDDECGLRRYLKKLVKHTGLGSAENSRIQGMITTVQNLMPNQAKELSDIFSDIALNSPGALQKLNEFRRRNPLVDLQKILSTMSPAFHRYFLAITGENEGAGGDGAADGNLMDDVQFSKEVGRMWGKLKSLQQRIESLKDT